MEYSERKRPVVVITASLKTGGLPLDPQTCYEDAQGSADVVVIKPYAAQSAFRELLGDGYYTGNGGLRVYPTDDYWRENPAASRYIPSSIAFMYQKTLLDQVLELIRESENNVKKARAQAQLQAERAKTRNARKHVTRFWAPTLQQSPAPVPRPPYPRPATFPMERAQEGGESGVQRKLPLPASHSQRLSRQIGEVASVSAARSTASGSAATSAKTRGAASGSTAGNAKKTRTASATVTDTAVIASEIADASAATSAARDTASSTPATATNTSKYPAAKALPLGQICTIEGVEAAHNLGYYLFSDTRKVPVLVLTRSSDRTEPLVDCEKLLEEIGDMAVIADLVSTTETWALGEILPKGLEIYGGACRVYPAGNLAHMDPYDMPIFFTYVRTSGVDQAKKDTTQKLIAEVFRQYYRDGYSSLSSLASGVAPAGSKATGTIKWLPDTEDNRVLVWLDDEARPNDGTSMVWTYGEALPLDLPVERLLQPGMQVSGWVHPSSHRFDIDPKTMRSAAEALQHYQTGMTVLARVQAVTADTCHLELYPGFTVPMTGDDLIAEEDLRIGIRKGDVLAVHIVEREGNEWLLAPAENSNANEVAAGQIGQAADMGVSASTGAASASPQLTPAPSVFPGGPPWIVPHQPEGKDVLRHLLEERHYDEFDVKALAADPAAGVDLIRTMWYDLQFLQKELEAAEAKCKDSENSRRQLWDNNRKLQAENKELQTRLGAKDLLSALNGAFLDEREQLDFEIRTAWALRIRANEKPLRPLGEWDYAPQFFDTLRNIEGVERSKLADVIVEILTGLVKQMPGRKLHLLRTGEGGNEPARQTPQGEFYMRVALQLGSPGGRRLHYYHRNDGVVVLSSVRMHNDYRE